MTINVSEALDGDTSEVVTVNRLTGGSYVDGTWITGTLSTFTALASVQQPTKQQLQRLPENQRLLDTRLFICNKILHTADDRTNQEADVIVYKGLQYTILAIGDWDSYGHTDAIGALL